MDAKTLSFGKNGEEPRVAFENIDAKELYPCVMFYSTNPSEKVKITDMKVHGTQKDLLPGEPTLAPLYTILAESYIVLIRRLHTFSTWTDDINEVLLALLSKIETLFPILQTHNIDDDFNRLEQTMKSEFKINELCVHVWPALAVICGLDRGLRMGGLCKHKATGKKGIILGILKKGITTVNVHWEQDGGVSNVSIYNIEYIEPNPFSTELFLGLSSNILLQIARLSGITNEITFPVFELTVEEKRLLNDRNKKSSSMSLCSESRLQPQKQSELPRSVETLTNEMVSDIMGVVRSKIKTETITESLSDSNVNFCNENQKKMAEKCFQAKLLEKKMLNLENEHLKLAFLQFGALKALGLFVTSPIFREQYFTNTKELGVSHSVKTIMLAIISRSIDQCKLRNVISLAEIERAQTVLHLSYTKNLFQISKCLLTNLFSEENCTLNNASTVSNAINNFAGTRANMPAQRLSSQVQPHSSRENVLGKLANLFPSFAYTNIIKSHFSPIAVIIKMN